MTVIPPDPQVFSRYAIYITPPSGPLAEFGAAWLGWDIAAGRPVPHPELPGLASERIAALTDVPRRYGFHGTIKPPFALAEGSDAAALADDAAALAWALPPVRLDAGLQLARLGGFLALIPAAPFPALAALAARVVTDLDRHRAPLTPKDRARRDPDSLTPAQRANLDRWGYPWVMEDFRFHLTLTGPLPTDEAKALHTQLAPHLEPLLPRPFVVDALTLCGQDADGRFHQIKRLPLVGD